MSFDSNYWQKRFKESEAKYAALPRWRWLKRSNLLEQIRMERRFAIQEMREQAAELRRKLGKD